MRTGAPCWTRTSDPQLRRIWVSPMKSMAKLHTQVMLWHASAPSGPRCATRFTPATPRNEPHTDRTTAASRPPSDNPPRSAPPVPASENRPHTRPPTAPCSTYRAARTAGTRRPASCVRWRSRRGCGRAHCPKISASNYFRQPDDFRLRCPDYPDIVFSRRGD